MKIILANLPWKVDASWGVRAGSRWPHIKTPEETHYHPFPFFLAYAAALLRLEGYQVKLIDCLAEEMTAPHFLKVVLQEAPALLVAETATPSLSNDLNILQSLPSHIAIALCGPETHIKKPEFLIRNERIDYVCEGEYEYTLLALARSLKNGSDPCFIRGLIYRANGTIKMNPPRALIEDLDELPWPLREGVPLYKYNDNPWRMPMPSAQMWTSRGCPYQCSFCLWPQLMYHSFSYRVRSPKHVVDEMEYLTRAMGFKSIYFDDDTANIKKARMLELSKEISRRDLKVPWAMMARADLMDEETLESLRSSGLFAIKYGVESADQTLLNNIHKNMDIVLTERMIVFTKSLGIKTHLTFTFGLPGETNESIKKTIDLALKLNPDSLQFSITTPFPGTRYFDELDAKGYIVSRIFSEYDGNSRSILRTDSLGADELTKAKRLADRRWQDHKGYREGFGLGLDRAHDKA